MEKHDVGLIGTMSREQLTREVAEVNAELAALEAEMLGKKEWLAACASCLER